MTEIKKAKQAWGSRLSAPGYMDCTEWIGPCDSEEEAARELVEQENLWEWLTPRED